MSYFNIKTLVSKVIGFVKPQQMSESIRHDLIDQSMTFYPAYFKDDSRADTASLMKQARAKTLCRRQRAEQHIGGGPMPICGICDNPAN